MNKIISIPKGFLRSGEHLSEQEIAWLLETPFSTEEINKILPMTPLYSMLWIDLRLHDLNERMKKFKIEVENLTASKSKKPDDNILFFSLGKSTASGLKLPRSVRAIRIFKDYVNGCIDYKEAWGKILKIYNER